MDRMLPTASLSREPDGVAAFYLQPTAAPGREKNEQDVLRELTFGPASPVCVCGRCERRPER